MVREALFSLLGHAVPDRLFFDLFAGTGAVGLEALSRGARHVTFVERDTRAASDIERHLREFDVVENADVVRADVYRWAERWPGAVEPVNVFLGPPYPDFERRHEPLWETIERLQSKLCDGSVLVLQSERLAPNSLPGNSEEWEERRYGRNHLWIWVKGSAEHVGDVEST
jgi:16S rRNA (guanine(966)-N(2))-methyltransferase RsmD